MPYDALLLIETPIQTGALADMCKSGIDMPIYAPIPAHMHQRVKQSITLMHAVDDFLVTTGRR